MAPVAPLIMISLGLGALLLTKKSSAATPPGPPVATGPAPDYGLPGGYAATPKISPELESQLRAVLGALGASSVERDTIQAASELASRLESYGFAKEAQAIRDAIAKARKSLPELPPDERVADSPKLPPALNDKINEALASERDPAKLRAILAALRADPAISDPQVQMMAQVLEALILQIEAQRQQDEDLKEAEKVQQSPPPPVIDVAPPVTSPGQPVQPIRPVPEPAPDQKERTPAAPAPQPAPPQKSQAHTAAEAVALNLQNVEKGYGLPKGKGREDRVLVERFQRIVGLTPDGNAGPGVIKAIAKYIGNLPHVFYWPKGSNRKTVDAFRNEIMSVASVARAAGETLRASQLEASASREDGRGGIAGPVLAPAPVPTPSPAKPAPTPPPAEEEEVSTVLVPDQKSLAGQTAVMLYRSHGGPVKDIPLLQQYKKSVGLSDTTLYGPGTGQSLMTRGIIPPTPWDWPPTDTKTHRTKYKNNLLYMGNIKDTARKTEWHAAAAKI